MTSKSKVSVRLWGGKLDGMALFVTCDDRGLPSMIEMLEDPEAGGYARDTAFRLNVAEQPEITESVDSSDPPYVTLRYVQGERTADGKAVEYLYAPYTANRQR